MPASSKLEQKHDAMWSKELHSLYAACAYLEECFEMDDFEGMAVDAIRVKRGNDGGSGKLVIVNVRVEGRKFIGFGNGDTVAAAIKNAAERLRNKTMKLREDIPWEERAQGMGGSPEG